MILSPFFFFFNVFIFLSQGDETYGSVEELRHMLPLLSSTELQQWLYIEDELFFPSHPELQKDLGNIVSHIITIS